MLVLPLLSLCSLDGGPMGGDLVMLLTAFLVAQ